MVPSVRVILKCSVLDLLLMASCIGSTGGMYGTRGLLILPLSTSSSQRPLGSALSSLIVRAFPRSVPINSFLKKDFEGWWAKIKYFLCYVLIVALYSRLGWTCPLNPNIVTALKTVLVSLNQDVLPFSSENQGVTFCLQSNPTLQ